MDVWVEFKNASKWQAEALFRNFFPSAEDEEVVLEGDLDGIDLPSPPTSPPQSPVTPSGSSGLWSMTSLSSSNGSVPSPSSETSVPATRALGPNDFGSKNKAYLPPPIEEHIAAGQHSAKPLDSATLAVLAKKFADSIPEEGFSVAALQGCEWFFFFDLFLQGRVLMWYFRFVKE